jgi:shikimate dehydrogenase
LFSIHFKSKFIQNRTLLTHHLALIGKSLSHSFSKKYFENLFSTLGDKKSTYRLIELAEIQEWKEKSSHEFYLTGFNVTIPYKREIFSMCDVCTREALATQSVNTVKISEGKWYGTNTDLWGFSISLQNFLPEDFASKAIILGDGGAAQAAKVVLEQKGIPFITIKRSLHTNEFDWQEWLNNSESYGLIVNATPLGMYPNEDFALPFPYHLLTEKHFLFDMIYNPSKTLFLSLGERQKAKIKNGQEMLIKQAEAAWNFWNSDQMQQTI